MKKIILPISFLLASIGLQSQDIVLHFDFNSDRLSVDSKTLLDEYASDLKLCDSVLLIGHTDTVGNSSYNDKLSYSRALSVQNWMIKNSIDTKTTVESRGENIVFSSNIDSLNRRVELFGFYHSRKFPEKEAQEFYINNSNDTTLYGKEGTLIKIPANSIKPKSGTNSFKVVLSEYYSISDIVFNKLSTRTDSEILETGGMINIEIFDNETKCTLDKKVQIGFPVQSSRNDKMDIFQGVENDDGDIIWRQSSDESAIFSSAQSSVFVIVEDMPQFQGGNVDDFQNFIQSNITYPQIAIDSGYCGRVIVSFTVGSDGSIVNARVVRGAHSSMNEEVLRAISQSPRWTPGRQRGQNVAVQFTIPFNFTLDGDCKLVVDSIGSGQYHSFVSDTTFNTSSVEQINYYVFNTLSLGWINCDWFVFKNKPKTNQKVYVSSLGDLSTHLIFSDYNVVISGSKYEDFFVFNSVPKNEKITVLGIKRIEEKVFFALEETTVSSQDIKLDDFTEITFDDLKQRLDDLKRAK